MVQTSSPEFEALRATATDGVTTSARLRREGISASTVATRCQLGGPWRRLLPGVIMLGDGEPTRRQQLRAAVHYTGPDAVVSGLDALRACGAPLMPSREVQVLVPPERRMQSRDFVSIERTSRLPGPVLRDGLPFAPPARAAMDAARRETDYDRLRRVLTLPVYYGLCTVADLRAELDAGNQRGSAAVRGMLRDLGSMGDTYLHGTARELLKSIPLPPPAWNVTICDRHGSPIGTVDAWWDEVALGWEFGAAVNNSPKMNHLALTAAGVILVRTEPERLRTNDERIARELASAFTGAAKRRRPGVLALGAIAA